VPECIPEWRSRFDAIVLVDSSGSMLDHSRNLAKDRVTLLIEDAIGTSIPDASANLVIASLGDPYNGPSLWIELGRMMAPGAMAIFTTPSADWAELFRRDGQLAPIDSAEFISDDGRLVYVPSVILREDEQCEMIRLAGLVPDKVVWRCVSDVNEAALAPKLRLLGPAEPYVTGYRVLKPKG
jgi:hypothetical protein